MKEALKASCEPSLAALEQFSKRLVETVNITRRTLVMEHTDGSNGSAMDAITELLDHEFIQQSKMRPHLNSLHKQLYKNAEANLSAKRRAEDDALKARAPKAFLPKNRGKVGSEPVVTDEEITDPSLVLNSFPE